MFFDYIKRRFLKLWNKLNFVWIRFFYPSNIVIIGKCNKCGHCCKSIMLYSRKSNYDGQAVFIKTEEEFLVLQKEEAFYNNLKVSGVTSNGELQFECIYLQENKCSIYKHRPDFCKEYPSVKMFLLGGSLYTGCGYRIKSKKDFKYYLDNFKLR